MSGFSAPDRSRSTLIAACSIAIGALVPVALFQCGELDHLPDPPFPLFSSDRITSSKAAHPFGIPDSLLGLASYGVTLALVMSAPRSRLAHKALGGKLLLDGSMATVNTVKQFAEFRRACSWCMLTAAATGVMVIAGGKYLSQGRLARTNSASQPVTMKRLGTMSILPGAGDAEALE